MFVLVTGASEELELLAKQSAMEVLWILFAEVPSPASHHAYVVIYRITRSTTQTAV